jgi:hypothetical protein
MSEFQYIGFRATEKPVGDRDLEYVRQQSTRAEITPWSFDNVYHSGDFHGDAQGMLRRGYDIHVHYANFGIRDLLIRLPLNLPSAPGAELDTAARGALATGDLAGLLGCLRFRRAPTKLTSVPRCLSRACPESVSVRLAARRLARRCPERRAAGGGSSRTSRIGEDRDAWRFLSHSCKR